MSAWAKKLTGFHVIMLRGAKTWPLNLWSTFPAGREYKNIFVVVEDQRQLVRAKRANNHANRGSLGLSMLSFA